MVAASAAGQQAQDAPAFKKVGGWGKLGSANGQFRNAFGLATDRSGKVYVADTDNHRVQVFSASGGFVRKHQFEQGSLVRDVAVAPDGSSWATDLNGSKAQQLSPGGGAVESLATPKQALGVAVDAVGNVFIATAGDNIQQVGRYDKTATGWEPGKTWGGFKVPHDVETSQDGSVYVSDNGSLTVKRFDSGGKLLKAIKAGPSAPLGIGVDLDCNLWVTNIAQRRVDKVSPSGKPMGSVTSGDLIARTWPSGRSATCMCSTAAPTASSGSWRIARSPARPPWRGRSSSPRASRRLGTRSPASLVRLGSQPPRA